MLECLFDNISHVVVGKGVKNILARFSVSDKVALAKHFQLMRNGRFRHSEKLGNIANAHRLAVYGEEYAHSRGITEYLEKVGKVVERFFIRHQGSLFFYNLGMQLLALTGWRIFFVHSFAPFYS